ncbi:MAG: MBL fold metallo-hydrolase, partial [Firmicutes bacterium]|nr:MBL fold metallo-hydrolase [Bacillota bacterium]MBR6025443.1 MBL fold metallo-hydrolase [Bacillota bacterium]
MTEEIYKNIYRIHVPLKGNPLKELNSYFIVSEGEELLIDNGFNTDECFEALKGGLDEIGCDFEKLRLVVTHLHSDHSGNTNRLALHNNVVYMSETDIGYVKTLAHANRNRLRDSRFLSEGFLQEWLDAQKQNNPAFMATMSDPDSLNYCPMHTGDRIKVGEYEFTWIECPGHTPGNSMLYEANHKILFTGDNILFTITPNITAWPERDDSLGDYLQSLEESRKYDVKYAFPGHREFESADYYARIDS